MYNCSVRLIYSIWIYSVYLFIFFVPFYHLFSFLYCFILILFKFIQRWTSLLLLIYDFFENSSLICVVYKISFFCVFVVVDACCWLTWLFSLLLSWLVFRLGANHEKCSENVYIFDLLFNQCIRENSKSHTKYQEKGRSMITV